MRLFFFPIETINRELDYKLFLACTILSKNNSIYIGQHDTLYSISRAFKYCLYLGKNLFLKRSDGTWVNRYDRFKKNKFKLVHLDEEGAFYQGNSEEWKRRLSRRLNFSKLKNAYYRFGTTGTLDNSKTHKLVIEGLFGPTIKVVSTKELIDKNILANLKINCMVLGYSDQSKQDVKRVKYQEEIDWIVSNKNRNKFNIILFK